MTHLYTHTHTPQLWFSQSDIIHTLGFDWHLRSGSLGSHRADTKTQKHCSQLFHCIYLGRGWHHHTTSKHPQQQKESQTQVLRSPVRRCPRRSCQWHWKSLTASHLSWTACPEPWGVVAATWTQRSALLDSNILSMQQGYLFLRCFLYNSFDYYFSLMHVSVVIGWVCISIIFSLSNLVNKEPESENISHQITRKQKTGQSPVNKSQNQMWCKGDNWPVVGLVPGQTCAVNAGLLSCPDTDHLSEHKATQSLSHLSLHK